MPIGRMRMCKAHPRQYAHMCTICDDEIRQGKRKPEERGVNLEEKDADTEEVTTGSNL